MSADDAKLRERAYRYLARREHSRAELRKKLCAPAYKKQDAEDATPVDPELVERVLTELEEEGAQSDQRFAEAHCRRRYDAGRGPVILRGELVRHGIDENLIQKLLADYQPKWRARAVEVRKKKFADAPTAYRDWAKQARFLQQRGFTAEQIGHYGDHDAADGG